MKPTLLLVFSLIFTSVAAKAMQASGVICRSDTTLDMTNLEINGELSRPQITIVGHYGYDTTELNIKQPYVVSNLTINYVPKSESSDLPKYVICVVVTGEKLN